MLSVNCDPASVVARMHQTSSSLLTASRSYPAKAGHQTASSHVVLVSILRLFVTSPVMNNNYDSIHRGYNQLLPEVKPKITHRRHKDTTAQIFPINGSSTSKRTDRHLSNRPR